MSYPFQTQVMRDNQASAQCVFAMFEGDEEAGIFCAGTGTYQVVIMSSCDDHCICDESFSSMSEAVARIMTYLFYDYLEGDDRDFVMHARRTA